VEEQGLVDRTGCVIAVTAYVPCVYGAGDGAVYLYTFLNSKSEYRNSKQYQISKIQISKLRAKTGQSVKV